ncbi:MAG: alpha/beta fold hydrolase [Acidimicrobiales bacterium]
MAYSSPPVSPGGLVVCSTWRVRRAQVQIADPQLLVITLIEDLVDGMPVTLVGQSMGAHTAMLTAAAHPTMIERSVMVEGGVGGGGQAIVRRVAEWLASWPTPFPTHEDALHYFGGSTPVAQAWANGLEPRSDGLWPRFDVDIMAASLAFVEDRACWTEWANISQPTLLVLGETGMAGSGEAVRMIAVRPDAEVVVVGAAGHDLHLEQTGAWLATLRGFLAG